MPSSSDQTRVGRTLTLGGGPEGRDIELSVSPKDIHTSPYHLCANRSDRRQSREGTDGSNPLPSSGESGANLIEAISGRHAVAFGKNDKVAAHHLGAGNAFLHAVADHQGARTGEITQAFEHLLGAESPPSYRNDL
jgi:hypothetical protein